MTLCNYLTIDVEDYFQVSAFENIVTKDDWDTYPSRVVQNTEKILSLLEENNVKATFFVLGWTAQKYPDLVKKISDQGHEIACHSYYHQLVYDLTPEEFREDTRQAKDILEQLTGKKILGYRAPSYSITKKSLWALEILHELGFLYDSSVFPIYHDRYGIPEAPRFPFLWDLNGDSPRINQPPNLQTNELINQHLIQSADQPVNKSSPLLELPISTSLIFGIKIPVSGGGYFRLFPYWFTKLTLRKINKQEKKPFVFYFHPWEIDPQQPHIDRAGVKSRFRHYLNIDKTKNRLEHLLQDFNFGPINP